MCRWTWRFRLEPKRQTVCDDRTNNRWSSGWRKAWISLPVHPRCGEEISIWRHHGPESVWAETSDGRLMILPIAWTSAMPWAPTREESGRPVLLALDALVALGAWVAARRRAEGVSSTCQEVGHFDKSMQKQCPDGGTPIGAGFDGRDEPADADRGGRPGERGGAAAVVEQASPPGPGGFRSRRAKQGARGS